MKKFLWAATASLMLWNCAGHEMSANKYNSITETLQGELLTASQALSVYATPPAAFTVPGADFATPTLQNASLYKYFNIKDIPIVQGAGIFCSIGDGLAPNPHVDFTVSLIAVNNVGVTVGTLITFDFPFCTNMNSLTATDFAGPTIAAIQASLPGFIASGATSLALVVGAVGAGWDFAAYSMAPGWAAALLQFIPNVIVEHTFPLKAVP